jgi:hypothetical protein
VANGWSHAHGKTGRGFLNSVTSEFSPYQAFVLGAESLCFEDFLRAHPVLRHGRVLVSGR